MIIIIIIVLKTLLTNAFVESIVPSTTMVIEATQNGRQIKRLNFLNTNSKLIRIKLKLKKFIIQILVAE